MGICWSNKIKSASPSNTGFHSRSASRDGSSSKASSSSMPTTPRSEGREILQSCNLNSISFSELKNATRNFHPHSVLGEGGFGSVFKGWIDESTLRATKAGTGIVIAVKRLNQDGFQGHKEWLDCKISRPSLRGVEKLIQGFWTQAIPSKLHPILPSCSIPTVLTFAGNSWEMTWNGSRKTTKSLDRKSWKAFIDDNNLKVRHGCVFELTECSSTRLVFRVQILRGDIPAELLAKLIGEDAEKSIVL